MPRAEYQQFHESAADSQKMKAINAVFAQGRMYFENARSAGLGVKPVLLYYGAMSLVVGLVLFRNRTSREESFKSAHGLTRGDWKGILNCGLDRVLDLDIKAASGIFRELASVAWHWSVADIYNPKNSELRNRGTYPELRPLGPIRFAQDQSTLTLRDLLSRSRYTGGGYADITGAPSNLHRAVVELAEGNRQIAIRPELSDELSGRSALSFQRDDPSIPLWNKDNSELWMTVVDDFPNGDRLSEFVKLYLLSYVVGMLARYFPSTWMSLIRNEAGSLAQPLLATAIRALETEFIREFAPQVAVVLDDPYLFGEHHGLSKHHERA